MTRKYPNLCKPITLGRVTFKNRMFSAPMGGTAITRHWIYKKNIESSLTK